MLSKINTANVSSELKAKLAGMVSTASAVDSVLMESLKATIDQEAENQIDQIAGLEMQTELDKYEKEMAEVGAGVDDFVSEMNKKADQIDLESVRNTIAGV